MKKLVVILLPVLFLSFNLVQEEKKVVTKTYTVEGVCGNCEKRIENAALIKGVLETDWDKHTQKLTVVYKTQKTNPDLILQAVADAGHDNEKFKATAKAYNKLPGCCKYRDNSIEVH